MVQDQICDPSPACPSYFFWCQPGGSRWLWGPTSNVLGGKDWVHSAVSSQSLPLEPLPSPDHNMQVWLCPSPASNWWGNTVLQADLGQKVTNYVFWLLYKIGCGSVVRRIKSEGAHFFQSGNEEHPRIRCGRSQPASVEYKSGNPKGLFAFLLQCTYLLKHLRNNLSFILTASIFLAL